MPDDHQQDLVERVGRGFAAASTGTESDNRLEASIGRQVRAERRRLDMTVVELARLAGLSAGMLSKIENGVTSPSLGTLQALARALNAPVTSLFTRYDETNSAFTARADNAETVARRGSRYGYIYRQLSAVSGAAALECYSVVMDD
ncbi:MAG: helix-turn-helix transcriptional regulator, partial [Pseudomonadota bacterium]